MGRRRTRASVDGKPPANGPVVVTHAEPGRLKLKPGWTREEVLDLLAQGYADEAIADRTGAPLAWVRKQQKPSTTLLERATASGTGVRTS